VSIVGSHHSGFHVSDLERSISFYCDLLGFEVVWKRVNREEYVRRIIGYPDADLHQAMLRFPHSDHCLELMDYHGVSRKAVDASPPNPGTAHLCLLVDDLQALFADLSAKGVASVSEPVDITSGVNEGGSAVYMIDPDGFRIELLQLPARQV
jgi:catechol 2,3-dioxygenase-like lactoylglutathione lyase family enzyme